MRTRSFLYWIAILGLSQAAEETTHDNIRSQLHSSLSVKESKENKKAEDAEYSAPYHEAISPLAMEESYSTPLLLEFGGPKEFQQKRIGVTVIIDVFRAFTTAPYVLEKAPATYIRRQA